jgi:hypothetical protein
LAGRLGDRHRLRRPHPTGTAVGGDRLRRVRRAVPGTRHRVSDYQLTRYRCEIQGLALHFPTIETIDEQAVAAWIRTLRMAGRAPQTIANHHGLLYAICAYAVRKGLLVHNPCLDSQLPVRTRCNAEGEPTVCFLEPEEFALIAEAMCAAEHYDWRPGGGRGVRRPHEHVATTGVAFRQDRDFITLAVHTGLRWGEITALRVGDVDTVRRLLSVKRLETRRRRAMGDRTAEDRALPARDLPGTDPAPPAGTTPDRTRPGRNTCSSTAAADRCAARRSTRTAGGAHCAWLNNAG